ncbi:PAS domain-containing protein [Devosia sp. Naph2]|uniref:PAS domain-containing protein n=1 Tax=Devosia polycyclovorans TaxID=3345148 RepID=UPI0035CF09E6
MNESSVNPETSLSFLSGGGATGALIRDHDWGSSPIGAPERWPEALKTLVSVMLSSSQPMFVAWGASRTLIYNDQYAQILAGKHPEALGGDFLEVWHEIRADLSPIVAQTYSGEPVQMDDIMLVMQRRGYPEETHFSFFYSPIRDDRGTTAGLFCACTEITGQIEAERQAERERMRQRLMLKQMPGFVALLVGPDHRFEYVNDAYREIAGERNFEGRTAREVFPEVEDQGYFEFLDNVYATGEAFSAHAAPILLAGETEPRYVDFLYEPIRDDAGAVTGIFVGGYEVTEQVRTRARLEESEERVRSEAERVRLALDAGAIVGTWVWAVQEDRFIADERFARSFALDPELCRQGLPLDLVTASIHPEDVDRVSDAIEKALQGGGAYSCEYRVRQTDGEYRWVEANGLVELDASGTAQRFPGVLIDIEEERKARIERDRSAAMLAAFIEAVPGVVYAKDRQGRMLVANRGATELIGKPPEEYLGKTDAEFLENTAQGEAVMANDRAVMESGVVRQIEETVHRPDGSPAIWLSTKSPWRDTDGTVIGLVGSSLDITARKEAEAALESSREELRRLNASLEERVKQAIKERENALALLHEARKVETLGQLTGGVAHDFNNLLTPIMSGLDILSRRHGDDERSHRIIAGALQASERAKTLVQRLLAFARRQTLLPKDTDICRLARDMRELLERTLGPQIEFRLETKDAGCAALVDPNQLELAILNLAVNARDAMPDGGALTISVDTVTVAPKTPHDTLENGDYVRVSVIDTGTGMDAETLSHAIEPFFTTKEVGQGTGLGLSMVHGLAAQSGGALSVRSVQGQGTTAEIWLPSSPCQSKPEPVQNADVPLPEKTKKVLLVDDEALIRMSVADNLVELGYEVIEAGSAAAALEHVRSGVVPDLLVTDHMMPRMTGAQLASELRGIMPDLPILMITGYADLKPEQARGLVVLAKPFRMAELGMRVAELLDGRRSIGTPA